MGLFESKSGTSATSKFELNIELKKKSTQLDIVAFVFVPKSTSLKFEQYFFSPRLFLPRYLSKRGANVDMITIAKKEKRKRC